MVIILLLEQETVILITNWDGLLTILLLPKYLLLLGACRHELLRILGRHNLGEVEGAASLA